MKILFLLHADFELPGYIESWAAEKGFELFYCSLFAGDPLPRAGSFDLIVSMGGPQSAHEDLEELKAEVDLLRGAIKAKIPVLGFCLGAQLIGVALGSPAERSPFKEIGIFPITLSEEGLRDPVLQGLPTKFLVSHWHGDMPGLTQESVVLAASDGCPRQIVRFFPHVYGFQCHPEMTHQTITELVKNCPEDFTQDKYVQAPEEILSIDFYALNHANIIRILENFWSQCETRKCRI